jgi:hypothetical protein
MTSSYSKEQVDLAIMAKDITQVKSMVNKISSRLESNYVTKEQLQVLQTKFEIVQRIVYGMVSIILVAFVTGLVSLIIR